MDFLTFISTKFTSEEQILFVNNFKDYLYNDQEKDFVVDLEKAYKFLGLSRKDNAKRLLVKSFQEDKDYKVLPYLLTGQSSEAYASAKETILMTPFTFKEFCIKANTEIAAKFRKYYIKLEYMFMKYLEHNLKETTGQLDSAHAKANALELELKKFRGRQRNKYEFGDTVYIVKEGNLFKVGSALNMNSREDNYYCHSNLAKVVYAKRCQNRKILEDVMHHRFSPFTYNNRKDWFIGVSFEELRKSMDDFQLLLDREASTYTIDIEALKDKSNDEVFPEYTPNVNEMTDNNKPHEGSIQHESTINKKDTTSNNEDNKKDYITPSEETQDITTLEINTVIEDPVESQLIPPTIEKLPDISPEFPKFIKECFIIKEGAKTSWVDIGAKYKLWSRSTGHIKEALSDYLKKHNFKETFIYHEDTKANCMAFEGLEMIPTKPFEVTASSSEVERFLYDTCVPNVTGRIASKDIYEKFVEWKDALTGDYKKISKNDKQTLAKYFNDNYLAAVVHTGVRMRFGYYGVSLKGS
jgi:hypothetical protein